MVERDKLAQTSGETPAWLSKETMTEAPLRPETLEAERKELTTLLASEIFRRAPTLARILEYLCERQMQGETFIKEYEIATRVMGRPIDFDPQVDGSVRVNLHHLRKKLRQYYELEGAQHAIEIALPVGQSLPSFLVKAMPADTEVAGEEPKVVESPSPASSLSVTSPEAPAIQRLTAAGSTQKEPVRTAWLWLAGVFLSSVVAALLTAWILMRKSEAPSVPILSDAVVRIACGRTKALHDDVGRVWMADTFATGGRSFRREVPLLADGGPAALYTQGREGTFSYAIPLPRSSYEVHLYFAETGVKGEGFRAMSIFLNGKRTAAMLDITSDAGGFATPTEKIYLGVQPAGDGKLHIDLKGVTGLAFLNGIEIMQASGSHMRTLRQTTLSSYYVDPDGIVWQPDAWFRGGRISHLQDVFPQIALEGMYENERFGNFTYSIPVVANHTYGVTLYFQDLWFSQNRKGSGARRFDVSCNGKQLLQNFDVLSQAAPGTNRVTLHFSGISSSGQGKLVFNFSPTENYASLNALKVEDETEDGNTGQAAPVIPAQGSSTVLVR